MKNIFLISIYITGLTVILYGYITGTTFLFAHILASTVLYNTIIFGSIFYTASGTVVQLFRLIQGFPTVYEWVLSTFFSLFVVILVTISIRDKVNIGELVRIYVAPVMFYSFFLLSTIGLLTNRYGFVNTVKVKRVWLIAAGSFVSGIVLYALKTNSYTSANQNFIVQYVLCMLCLVVPMYTMLSALVYKIMRNKK